MTRVFYLLLPLFMALLLSGPLCFSQNPAQIKQMLERTQLSKLDELAQEFQSKYKIQYDRALALAKVYNWPLKQALADGGWLVLDGVDEFDMPIFVGSENRNSAVSSALVRVFTNQLIIKT